MSTLFTDDFNRANGSTWGANWTKPRGTSNYNITGNKGAVDTNSGSYCVFRAGAGTSNDTEQIVTIVRANTNDVAGLVFRYTDNNNWYFVEIGQFTNFLTLNKLVGGSFTSGVAFGPSSSFPTTTTYTMRVRNIGTSIKARIWDASGSEPSTWQIDTTDASLSTGGYGIVADPWTSTALTFDDYTATDGATGTTYTINANDTSNATDTKSITASTAKTDTSLGTESNTYTSALSSSDTSNGTDTRTFQAQTSKTDSANATDAASYGAQTSRSDTALATGVETAGALWSLSASDTGAATDLSTTGSALARADTALATDIWSLLQVAGIIESSNATESRSITTVFNRPDTAIATDTYSFSAPVAPVGIAVSFFARSGAIAWRGRSGAVVFATRSGAITWRLRK